MLRSNGSQDRLCAPSSSSSRVSTRLGFAASSFMRSNSIAVSGTSLPSSA